jgi:cystathionine beta-lyase/cystathionine gamma-synthase
MYFNTKLVQAGHEPDPSTGALIPPIDLASTYEQRVQTELKYFYGRGENPTRERLESCLASLEDARHALVFSSGQAAGMTALSLLESGQKVIVSDDIYGGTYSLLSMLPRYGIEVMYLDLSNVNSLNEKLSVNVGLIWIETPTNPLLKLADIKEIAARAHKMSIPVLVDNTFASPVLQQPLEHFN